MATRLGLYGGPRSALGAGAAIASVSLSGTAVAGLTESDLDTGGKTFVWTLANDTFAAAGTGPIGSTADTQALIDGIVSDGAEAFGWNNIRSNIAVTDVTRDSDTQATLTLPALTTHEITSNEVLTSTVPAAVLSGGSALVAPETVTITADAEVSTGGHFIPGLAGIRAGKRRKPREALEAAAEVVEEIVEDVLEDDEPEKPTVQRVSRKRKSAIIDRAAEELARQGVFIGDITALERAATRIAKVAIKRRRAHLSALQDQKKARIQAESRAVLLADEDEVIAAAVLLLLRDDT